MYCTAKILVVLHLLEWMSNGSPYTEARNEFSFLSLRLEDFRLAYLADFSQLEEGA